MIPPSAGQVIWEDSVSSGVPFNLECCDVVAGSHEHVAAALAHLQPAKINAATTTAAIDSCHHPAWTRYTHTGSNGKGCNTGYGTSSKGYAASTDKVGLLLEVLACCCQGPAEFNTLLAVYLHVQSLRKTNVVILFCKILPLYSP